MDWRDVIGDHEVFTKIYQLARPYLVPRDGELHVQIVLDFASRLMKSTKCDRGVIIPAVILHDTGRSAIPQDKVQMSWGPNCDRGLVKLHELKSVKIAGSILQEVGYDASKVVEIFQIIEGHDTRSNAISLNDKIVRDADRLSRYTKHDLQLFVKTFGIVADLVCLELEKFIKQWFLLPESRDMARKELMERRREIETGILR